MLKCEKCEKENETVKIRDRFAFRPDKKTEGKNTCTLCWGCYRKMCLEL